MYLRVNVCAFVDLYAFMWLCSVFAHVPESLCRSVGLRMIACAFVWLLGVFAHVSASLYSPVSSSVFPS